MSPESRRAQQVVIAQRLRIEGGGGEGLTIAAIAREMGISVSYAAVLLSDPTGEKERERKRKYKPRKKRRKRKRKWTKPLVIEAIQEWVVMYGRPPLEMEWYRRDDLPDWCPTYSTVFRLFGKGGWNKAIESAGFTPRPAHAPDWTHNYDKPPPMDPEIRKAMSEQRKALYAGDPGNPMFRGVKEGWGIRREQRERDNRRFLARQAARQKGGIRADSGTIHPHGSRSGTEGPE